MAGKRKKPSDVKMSRSGGSARIGPEQEVITPPSASSAVETATVEPDNRWWLFLMGNNPELGSGRYGYWANKPSITRYNEIGALQISGDAEEPEVWVFGNAALSAYVAQVHHVQAVPGTT